MMNRRCAGWLVFVAPLMCVATAARSDEVTLIRDTFGVPHIFADTPEAGAYGVGRAQCEDNLAMVIRNLFAGTGRLAELMGPAYLQNDIQARELGHAHFAARDWDSLSPALRRLVQAYCDGVNDYLNDHPNVLPFAVPKVEPVQVIAWHRSVFLLSAVAISHADAEASEASGYHPVYSPDQTTPASHPGIPPGKSNSWVLAGSKTRAGVPMLLIDPHWATEGPLQLYEAYLHAGPLECGGFMLCGTPLPGIGVTPAAAWTVTAGGADSSDAYALRINPDNPRQYEFDGKWEDMLVRRETIRIRDAESTREHVTETLATRHGPVFKTKTGFLYAAAYAGHNQADMMEQNYRMVMARNTRQLKAAIALDRYTYFNLMWATREGDIGYVQTGDVPLRPHGFDWHKIVPGWTSRASYQGQVPFQQLPQVENPPLGFLQNCNVAANVVTPGLRFTQQDFPIGALWGHYGQYRARGQRATELLSKVVRATPEDGRRIAFDAYVPPADLWIPLILQAYEEHTNESDSEDEVLSHAIESLKRWDRRAARDSDGATLFRFWRLECEKIDSPVGRDRFEIPNSPALRQDALRALELASRRLMATYGKLSVPWGEIKVLRRGRQEWPLSGDGLGALGMDTLRATAADRFDDQGKLVLRGGQCVTSIVLLSDPPEILSVVAYGQSNNPESPHYADQAPLYSGERLRQVAWTREQLKDQIESQSQWPYDSDRAR